MSTPGSTPPTTTSKALPLFFDITS